MPTRFGLGIDRRFRVGGTGGLANETVVEIVVQCQLLRGRVAAGFTCGNKFRSNALPLAKAIDSREFSSFGRMLFAVTRLLYFVDLFFRPTDNLSVRVAISFTTVDSAVDFAVDFLYGMLRFV